MLTYILNIPGTKVAASVPQHGEYPNTAALLRFKSTEPSHVLPTVVTYSNFDDAIGNDLPPKDDDALESFRWFKLDALSSAPDAEKKIWSDSKNTERPARELLRTFLQGLHQKIRQCVLRMYPGIDWNKEYIDFVFSIPSVVGLNGASNMMKLAKESDFDSASGRHKVVDIALTEPEAAGVHIVRQLSESTGLKVRSNLSLSYRPNSGLMADQLGALRKATQLSSSMQVAVLRYELSTPFRYLEASNDANTSFLMQDLSMMTLIDDDKWKLDTNFLQPVSSQQLGGAHIDLAILNLLGKFFLDHGCLPTDVHHLVNCVYTLPKFFTSKTKLETLECTCPQSPGVLFPPMPGHGDEIRVVNGKLTIEK